MPPIKSKGMNTAISDKLMDKTVKPTSRVPCSAAWAGGMPFSMWREMFSNTTTASSTTNPVATAKAMSDRLFKLKPDKYITVNVPISDMGTAILGINAARLLRKNKNTTSTTRITEAMRARSTSCSAARMVGVRSIASDKSMAPGIDARSCGSKRFTRSTVSIMLAPGCRFKITSTAGLPLASPALRKSCTESLTSAISLSRTAVPLR